MGPILAGLGKGKVAASDLGALENRLNSARIKNTYKSIKDAPKYPEGFTNVRNGTKKVNINNKDVLDQLRQIENGKWKKVYKDGFDTNGKKISIHYFESLSGKVFDVKVKSGWSNQ